MVLGLVVVVVVGLAVLRLSGSEPDTAPAPGPTPVRVSAPARQAWPDDLPAGTLFAGAAGRVYTIDTSSGALARTSAEADPGRTSMTRLGDDVLVWRQGSRTRQLLEAGSRTAAPVRGELRSATSFLPGPGGRVWTTRGPRSGSSTWRLVDADGRVTTSVEVDGAAVSDGAGGLFGSGRQDFRPTFPRPRRPRQAGQVIAAGPDGYLVRSCAETECRFTVHRHGDDTGTAIDTAVGEVTSGGTLSPSNRFLAVTETVGGTSTVRVSVVASGQVLDIFAEPKESRSDAVWLDDRWLALISEDHLVLYDAADDRVVTPAVPLSSVGPLAWRPA